MTHSDSLDALAADLAKAQLEMSGAKRESDNPYFKSRYADLASVREACLNALNRNGLSVTQWPRLIATGEHEWMVEVETRLTHATGQWMADTLALPLAKLDAQGVGSCITYARRYALAAIAGVAPEDDDAEAAVGRGTPTVRSERPERSEDNAPTGAGYAIVTTVTDVRQKSGTGKKGPYIKFTVHTPDGEYSTFDRHLAELAKVAKLAAMPVEIDYRETQFGRDLLALKDAGTVADPVL